MDEFRCDYPFSMCPCGFLIGQSVIAWIKDLATMLRNAGYAVDSIKKS